MFDSSLLSDRAREEEEGVKIEEMIREQKIKVIPVIVVWGVLHKEKRTFDFQLFCRIKCLLRREGALEEDSAVASDWYTQRGVSLTPLEYTTVELQQKLVM
ncbi:hypothetical protein BgiBS90_015715 [Biomphalaria glabrata]|nr:hypothetical protein BgiBS90_015715 [Biomphalaria glabrata]